MAAPRRRPSDLPHELALQAQHIERIARAFGLDFHEVRFELLAASDVNGIAAYGGFPVRYPSWRFGMEFERLDKSYAWGLSKIYELVINNDPVVAYLVSSNSLSEQKLVMAHVFGHADFFKHNGWFAGTDRHMLDTMAAHATCIRRTVDRVGLETVERFIDLALSLENLLDPYLPLREHLRRTKDPSVPATSAAQCVAPTHDVLGYLALHAPLEDWQREIVALVRAEAYYFQPQRMTKIMNEGWASFWHSRMLTHGVLDASEIVDFADCHSGATAQAPGRLNPYKLGIELFRWAEERGDDIFRLRRMHNDVSLIDELMDEHFIERQQMFVYGRNARSGKTEVLDRDWKKIKAKLLADLAWGGLPRIELVGVDAKRELVLLHHHDGRDLQLAKAQDTLRRLAELWNGPVSLETTDEGRKKRLCLRDGAFSVEDLAKPDERPGDM